MLRRNAMAVEFPRRETPEVIVLPVRDGVTPSGKPPVRIYLGTEPAQYRAERTFMWSVERHRDPARVYEVALLKSLANFATARWLTGFTNYRFAIPHFAGFGGKAIYNDTDQLYLDDPGKLFDLDLGDHAYLAVSPRDTSVMLLDCAKMGAVWTLDRARRWRKNRLIDAALAIPGAYGELAGEWNARDQEYVEGRSKCVHFTTIHKQPWRPFPERFVYQPNPLADVYHAMEEDANAAGYNVFSRARPSAGFASWLSRTPRRTPKRVRDAVTDDCISDLLTRSGARSILEIDAGAGALEPVATAPDDPVERYRIGIARLLQDDEFGVYDGVACLSDLERVPLEDVPWVVDVIAGCAARFVFVAARNGDAARALRPHHGTVLRPTWWASLLKAATHRRAGLHWSLAWSPGPRLAHDTEYRQGGAYLGAEPPVVWVLEDHKPGHTTQSLGLMNALGWPYRRIKLAFGPRAKQANFLRGATLRGLTAASASELTPPWPDLVVASGARAAPVAEWIRRESKGRTRTVVLGRKGAHLGNEFDLAVAPAYVGLYPDPRRLETTAPLTRVRQSELDEAAAHWQAVLGAAASPRIALLVGGDDSVHALDSNQARRMGGEVATLARSAGGSVFVTTSRRTDTDAARALVDALGNVTAHSYHWSIAHREDENPYLGYLALADMFIVSGESASMLAEASATGKPVLIYPLAKRGHDTHRVKFLLGQRLSAWIMDRAFSTPHNRRGLERPQAGLERLCARLAAGGWVRPHGDITKLHEALIARGVARYFDGAMPPPSVPALNEAADVAARVRQLVGLPRAGT